MFVSLILYICYFSRRIKLHKKVDPSVLLTELPGVSIVKPLMGLDPLLETNLESHFVMNYPKVCNNYKFYSEIGHIQAYCNSTLYAYAAISDNSASLHSIVQPAGSSMEMHCIHVCKNIVPFLIDYLPPPPSE